MLSVHNCSVADTFATEQAVKDLRKENPTAWNWLAATCLFHRNEGLVIPRLVYNLLRSKELVQVDGGIPPIVDTIVLYLADPAEIPLLTG